MITTTACGSTSQTRTIASVISLTSRRFCSTLRPSASSRMTSGTGDLHSPRPREAPLPDDRGLVVGLHELFLTEELELLHPAVCLLVHVAGVRLEHHPLAGA